MDVVYNHTYCTENPKQYRALLLFRQTRTAAFPTAAAAATSLQRAPPWRGGTSSTPSSTGQRSTAIDGFRFDLMGLHDAESINAVRTALDSLPGGRDILLYGEPWQGGASQLHRYEANKANLAMLQRAGASSAMTPGTPSRAAASMPGSRAMGGQARQLLGYRRSGGGMVPQRPSAAPRAQPDRELCFRPRQLYHNRDKLLCVRYEKPEVHRPGHRGTGTEPAGGGHLSDQLRPALHAGRRGVRPHQKGGREQLPLLPTLNRLDWNRAEKYHALVGITTGGFWRCGQPFPAGQHRPSRPGGFAVLCTGAAAGGWTPPAVWGDGAAWSACVSFYNPTETACAPFPCPPQWKPLSNGTSSSFVARPKPHFCKQTTLCAVQRHHFWCGVKQFNGFRCASAIFSGKNYL